MEKIFDTFVIILFVLGIGFSAPYLPVVLSDEEVESVDLYDPEEENVGQEEDDSTYEYDEEHDLGIDFSDHEVVDDESDQDYDSDQGYYSPYDDED